MTVNKNTQQITGNDVLDVLKNPKVTLEFDMTSILYTMLGVFVALTLSGLAVEGIKKLLK